MIDETKIKSFSSWLQSCGCDILPPTNAFEILRFHHQRGCGVVYKGKRGISASNPTVLEAYQCFETGEKWAGKGRPTKKLGGSKRKRTLINRDGNGCFYCGLYFEAVDLTQEHLIPACQGGPDKVSNLVLACGPCNREAGHKHIIEKINLRDQKRALRGNMHE